MTFAEIAKLTGLPLRMVQLELTKEDSMVLRMLGGKWGPFDPMTQMLNMVKPVYGLKDAPKAWRLKLRQLLFKCGVQELANDPQVYLKHASGYIVCILSTHVDDLK